MYVIDLSSCRKCFFLSLSMIIVVCSASAQSAADSLARAKRDKENHDKAKITEIYSPVPPIVTPGKTDAEPPSDALILFDGKNLDLWRAEGPDSTRAAGWKVHD